MKVGTVYRQVGTWGGIAYAAFAGNAAAEGDIFKFCTW